MHSWIVASFLMLAPALAAAQVVCPPGLVAVDAARCCWPGQALSPDGQACLGTPQCPQGQVPYGATCVLAPSEPVAPPPPMPMPVAPPLLPGAQAVPLAAGGGFPVHFEARNEGSRFTVTIDDGASCDTPCDLPVTAGKHRVRIDGEASYQDDVRFPATPARVVVDNRRGGYLALGITSLAIGVPGAAIGAVCTLLGLLGVAFSHDGSNSGSGVVLAGGLAGLAGGVVLAAVGGSIGLRKAGRSRVYLARPEGAEAESARVALTGIGLAPTSGGAMVGASFSF